MMFPPANIPHCKGVFGVMNKPILPPNMVCAVPSKHIIFSLFRPEYVLLPFLPVVQIFWSKL